MHFRARYYDTVTGEFISRDPLEYVDGMSLYRGYFVPNGMDSIGLCSCGPDVTDWFGQQLKSISGFSKQHHHRSDEYQNLAKTIKFEDAGLNLDCGPVGDACQNSVTLCGKCIDATELGNIAYGFSLSHVSIDVMIFGGLYAEVLGRGFDSPQDLAAAVAGQRLSDFTSSEDLCSKLESPRIPNIWGVGNILNSVEGLNSGYWAYSLIPFGPKPTDVLASWNQKHGDWNRYVQDVLLAFNPDEQFSPNPPAPKTLWDQISKEGCEIPKDCVFPSNSKGIQIGTNGVVTWPN